MYRFATPSSVLRLSDGASIPFDLANADYAAFLAWCEAGNTPAPYTPPPPAPVASVTMRQARLALFGSGLLGLVESAIAGIEDPIRRQAAQIEWEYAGTVDRDSAFTLQLSEGLGLTNEQLDALFAQAAKL